MSDVADKGPCGVIDGCAHDDGICANPAPTPNTKDRPTVSVYERLRAIASEEVGPYRDDVVTILDAYEGAVKALRAVPDAMERLNRSANPPEDIVALAEHIVAVLATADRLGVKE